MKPKKITLTGKTLVARHRALETQLHRIRFIIAHLAKKGDVAAARFCKLHKADVEQSRRIYTRLYKQGKT